MKQSIIILSMALAALSQPVMADGPPDGPQRLYSENHSFKNITPEERLGKRQLIQQKWEALTKAEQQKFINEAKKQLKDRQNNKHERRIIMMYSFYQKNPNKFDSHDKGMGPHPKMRGHKERGHHKKGEMRDRQAMRKEFEQAKEQWDALSKQEQDAFREKMEARKEAMEARRAESMAKRLFAQTLDSE